jgi:hypothetical protein
MALSSLSPNMAPTETSGDIVDFGEYGFLSGALKQDPVCNGLYWLHASEAMEYISGYK